MERVEKLNDKKVYSEIFEILNILGEKYYSRIPKSLYNLIDEERDKNYNPQLLKEDGLLDESKLSKDAIAMFAVLNVKYFLEDNNEKQEYLNILKINENKYQEKLREQYNPDNMFNNRKSHQIQQQEENKQEMSLVEIKENIFTRFFRKLKQIFHKK